MEFLSILILHFQFVLDMYETKKKSLFLLIQSAPLIAL